MQPHAVEAAPQKSRGGLTRLTMQRADLFAKRASRIFRYYSVD